MSCSRPGCQWQRGVPAHVGGDNCDCNRIVIAVGSGDNNNHPGIVVIATTPWMTMTMMSWLENWWGPNNRNNIAAFIINGNDFWFGLSPL
jgi:hypothetical protein